MKSSFFHMHDDSRCLLCGSNEKLTREHKIKATVIKQRLGKKDLVLTSSAGHDGSFTTVQSYNSNFLKFKKKICEKCNTSRTQQADREFDSFLSKVLISKLNDSDHVSFLKENITINVFRYYAKILCCEIAEMPAPILTELANFAIGFADDNPINIRLDLEESGVENSVARGGLTIGVDPMTRLPWEFYSFHIYERAKFTFSFSLSESATSDLIYSYPDFISRLDIP